MQYKPFKYPHADRPHPPPQFPGNPLWEAHLPDNITPVGYGNSVIIKNKLNIVSVTQSTPLTALPLIASLGHCPHFFLQQKNELCGRLLSWSSNLTLVKRKEDRTDTDSEWGCIRRQSARQWDNWWGAIKLPAEPVRCELKNGTLSWPSSQCGRRPHLYS